MAREQRPFPLFARIPDAASGAAPNRLKPCGSFWYRLNSLLPAVAIVLMVLPVARQNIDRWFTVELLVAWVLIAVIQRPEWPVRMRRLFYLIPLWLAYASYYLVAAGTDLKVTGSYVLFLAPALMFDYYRKDTRTLVILTVVGIVSFLGGAITSIGILIDNPMAARLVSTSLVDTAGYADLAKSGVGDYRFTYGVALLLPFLVAIAADSGRTPRHRVSSLACSCVLAYYLYLATFAMSICIMVAGTLLALFHHIRHPHLRFVASIATIITGSLFLAGFGADLMSLASRSVDNKVLSIKADQMASLLSGTLRQTGFDRATLYGTSIDTFLEHPVTGVGAYYGVVGSDIAMDHGIGSHSELFDTLARFGLVGAGIYLSILLPLTFRAVSEWKGTAYGAVASSMWILFILLVCFNAASGQTEIGVTVFLLWPALPHTVAALRPARAPFRRLGAPNRCDSVAYR